MTENNPYFQTGYNSFEEMYKAERPFVFSVISYKVKNRVVAEDLTQDSFVKVLSALERNMYAPQEHKTPQNSFRNWLSIVAVNTTFNYFKKRKFEPADYDHLRNNDHSNPEKLTIEKEGLESAVKAINSISNVKKREIARLWFLEDRSYQEIKDELAIPLGSVMSGLNRAKKEIRAFLGEE